jgi:hypothetical protein
LDAVENALALNWYLPEDVAPDRRKALVEEGHQRRLLDAWPRLPQKIFGGKSARDVEVDPTGMPVMAIPLARLARVDASKLSDQDLLVCYERAQQARYLPAVQVLGRQIVSRSSLDEQLDKSAVYAMLAQLAKDAAEASQLFDEARRVAEAKGNSSARIDLIELSALMGRGDVQSADRVLQHIRNEHLREPGIAQALYSLLAQWGIIRPDGSMAAPAGEAVLGGGSPAAAEAAGKIWTPGSDPAPGGGKKPAIWTPGM